MVYNKNYNSKIKFDLIFFENTNTTICGLTKKSFNTNFNIFCLKKKGQMRIKIYLVWQKKGQKQIQIIWLVFVNTNTTMNICHTLNGIHRGMA